MSYIAYIDCDGTLLNDQGVISEKTKQTLSHFMDLGNKVVLCTGRPRYLIEDIMPQVHGDRFFISSNGAEIYNYQTQETLQYLTIEEQDFYQIYQYAVKHHIRLAAGSGALEFVTLYKKHPQELYFPENMEHFLQDHPTIQILLLDSNETVIQKAKQYFDHHLKTTLVLEKEVNPNEAWISLGNENVSKGNAITKLNQYLNIVKENTLVFGNDYNDLSMFEVAGTCVAMQNAVPELKEKANHIALSNNEDGVAHFLENWIQQSILSK